MSLNKVLLIGRLGGNPEIRYTPGGAAVANFSVATNEVWNDKNGQKQERTEWHRVVVWGKLAQLCGEYLTKGRQVYVEGRIQTRQWQDKEGQTKYTTEVIATTVQFLGAGTGASASSQSAGLPTAGQPTGLADNNSSSASFTAGSQSANLKVEESSFTEEDIPF